MTYEEFLTTTTLRHVDNQGRVTLQPLGWIHRSTDPDTVDSFIKAQTILPYIIVTELDTDLRDTTQAGEMRFYDQTVFFDYYHKPFNGLTPDESFLRYLIGYMDKLPAVVDDATFNRKFVSFTHGFLTGTPFVDSKTGILRARQSFKMRTVRTY